MRLRLRPRHRLCFLGVSLLAAPALAAAPPADQLPAVLSLAAAVEIARGHQPQLRQAHAQTEAAAARSDESRAGLLPQVNANASFGRTWVNPNASAQGAPINTPTTSSTNLNSGVVANQLIYDFGQSSSRWRSAQASEESQRQTERATLLQVLLNVRSAYLNARANKSLVAVARETLDNQNRHLAQVKAFVEVGTRPEIDLAQARSDQATAELKLIQAGSAFAIARAQLRQAMGVNGTADFDIADESVAAVAGEEAKADDLLEQALGGRPEFRALEQQLLAQELALRATRGTFGPALGATAGGNYRHSEFAGGDSSAWTLNAGLTLQWALLEGGLQRGRLRESAATLDNLRAGVDLFRQQVAVEVEQARVGITSSKGAIAAAEKALLNARERLRLAEARYQTGVGNALELSDAQLAVTNAGVQLLQAEFQLGAARAQLLKALGA